MMLRLLRQNLFKVIFAINVAMIGLLTYSLFLTDDTFALHREKVSAGSDVLLHVTEAHLFFEEGLRLGAPRDVLWQIQANLQQAQVMLNFIMADTALPGSFHREVCMPLKAEISKLGDMLERYYTEAEPNNTAEKYLQLDAAILIVMEMAQEHRVMLVDLAQQRAKESRNLTVAVTLLAALLFIVTMLLFYLGSQRLLREKSRSENLARKDEAILNSAVNGIIATDEKGLIETVNPAACELFGYEQQELIGKPVAALMPEDVAGMHDMFLRRYVATGEKAIIGIGRELHARKRNGELFPVYLSIGEYTLDGSPRFTAIIKDNSETKEMERKLREQRDKAERASKAKTAFLSVISHELRTPLNGVIGMLSVMQDADLPAAYKENLEIAFRSANNLVNMVSQILDLTKIESEKLELESLQFDLFHLIEEVNDLFAPQAEAKGVAFSTSLSSDLPREVIADPTRLRQILSNLAANAVKFTREGEIRIEVTAVHGSSFDNGISIRVIDTGIGIGVEKLGSVFDPFVQADYSTTREYGGTGLGLTIVKNLVELMGGRIDVSSTLDQGTVFNLTLPLEKATQLTPIIEGANTGLSPEKATFAVLCDPESLVSTQLEQCKALLLGGVLVGGNDAEDLISGLEQQDTEKFFDLIFIYFMDVSDSNQWVKKLRQHTQFKERKLVVVADSALPGQGKEARDAGASAFLTRPLSSDDIDKAIEILTTSKAAQMLTKYDLHESKPVFAETLLLVEDDLVNQKVALAMLKKLGYRADVACNGLQAVAAIEQDKYPIILMDVMMPEMDGFEATALIRNKSADSPRIIIAMTANAMDNFRETCIQAGMDDYISKPLDMDALGSLLARWVEELDSQSLPASQHKVS